VALSYNFYRRLARPAHSAARSKMSTESNQYDGPALCVVMIPKSEDGRTKYEWRVTLTASDSMGHRNLGYRASGVLDSLYVLAPDFPIEVRDADRAVWTTMNPGDRRDIRQRMETLLVHAMKAVSESGYWPPPARPR
jgi:hypothetical protein